MKLLFDQNLSPRLPAGLADVFLGSTHVALVGLGSADDGAVWEYARAHGYVVVSKDADFNELSIVRGSPPKVVWIRRGNCSTGHVERLLRSHVAEIESLREGSTGVLVIF